MDLTKKTRTELLDLNREITKALDEYGNRDKILVYTIFIPFTGTDYFIKKDNAIEHLRHLIDLDLVYSEHVNTDFSLRTTFLNEAELERYCKDYEDKSNAL